MTHKQMPQTKTNDVSVSAIIQVHLPPRQAPGHHHEGCRLREPQVSGGVHVQRRGQRSSADASIFHPDC